MHIDIEEDACIGAGQCVLAAPVVFGQREDDGIVFLLAPDAPASERANVEEAANRCPARAIRVNGG
ncbi:ferredoxin [Rhodococcus wratislaviensis]|uniref:Ferredoxin n=1 Tax=Rhodococcus wratislaviensis NBRC 100605 TaxID=1219028 RepID=X0Q7S5_RHOWR|nr:ferredoxin [Rhodococcus wratislaviensis]GAF47467.1 putative 3Fe-4S ferredoxin [Rhodococcus wratislaviensis NBRC 100605]